MARSRPASMGRGENLRLGPSGLPGYAWVAIAVTALAGAFTWGAYAHTTFSFPYPVLKQLWELSFPQDSHEIPQRSLETPAARLIRISSKEDVVAIRTRINNLLWGQDHLPNVFPSRVEEIVDHQLQLSEIARLERVVIDLDFGLISTVYLMHPARPNRRLVLYHEGHDGDFRIRGQMFAKLLRDGYVVAAFAMPLLGMNRQPVVDLPHLGILKLSTHDHLKLLDPPVGHPLRYFIEPVVAVVNQLVSMQTFDSIAMFGLSGGGWTTTLAAAIDPRITHSFPVAGSFPVFLRSESSRDWGDWEQTEPTLAAIAGDLDLYVLGAVGAGRKQIQILNEFDSCCFSGRSGEIYAPAVSAAVRSVGSGEWALRIDGTHKGHVVSPASLDFIHASIQTVTGDGQHR